MKLNWNDAKIAECRCGYYHTGSLSQRANVHSVSFKNSLQWPNYSMDSIDKPKLSFYTHNCATPLIFMLVCGTCGEQDEI